MGDRTLNVSADPVADVLLDFQAVMTQFLELQNDVLSALANGTPAPRPAQPLRAWAPPPSGAPSSEVVVDPPVPTADVAVQPHPTATTADRVIAEGSDEASAAFVRYGLSARERPASGVRAALAQGHSIVITDEGGGVAAAVAERLRQDGWRVALLAEHSGTASERDLFASPLDSFEEAERVTRRIEGACGPIAALIHLAPLSPAEVFETLDDVRWWQRLSFETRRLFLLSKAIARPLELAAAKGGAALMTVTSMGGTFGVDDTTSDLRPSHAGVVGFAKCVAIEWPDVRVRALDVDPGEPIDRLAAHVIEELWSADRSIEVGYRHGLRMGIDVMRAPATLDPAFAIPNDAVILATGGARGITAEVCLDLAERYQPTFVIVGQSPLPSATEPAATAALRTPAELKRALIARQQAEGVRVTPATVEKACRQLLKEREIRDTISRLSAAGARTHYVQLDVQDGRALAALLDEIYETYGRLDGVIHGAGIIEDKLVRDKSLESFDRVFRTKAISAFVLSRHLKADSLRFAIFFSSVAGRFGNRGQADYAAANEVASKIAVALQRRCAGRVSSIAWAPWDKLGMVSPELKTEFLRRGVELLPPAAGRRAFWQELQQGRMAGTEVVIGGRAPAALAAGMAGDVLPLLKHAARQTSNEGGIRFFRRIDPSIDLYLQDHRLDGRPVLPLAFATELMAEAAQAAHPDLRVVAVRDLQLLKGIVVDAGSVPIAIAVSNAREGRDGTILAAVEIQTPEAPLRTRYRADVQMVSGDAHRSPAFAVPAWPLSPLTKSVDRAYRDWTFHGPLFQRVTDIAGIGVNSMVATIYSSSAIPVLAGVARPDWIIDPFVFDGALQLLLMWSRAHNDKTALPSRFSAFTRHAPLSDQPLTCYVAVESLSGGHALRSNVHFVDGAGRLAAVLDTMEASCAAALNRLAGAGARHGGAL